MEWWKEKVIYQIYPRSFCDANGDGLGDLQGITSKLDYLKDLGVGAIWLSPHYPSPFLDCGYDISDYCSVGEEYGNLEDFKEFLREAHKRDIKVILDLVLNHTSDQHPWFLESKSSKDNPKRDWYIWKENKGSYPNDWQSCFLGSAWTLDEKTDEYYYHFFLKEQPDLNWRNDEVKNAMFDVMRFWLNLGIDGFRIDAITAIYEDLNLTNQGWTAEEFREKSKDNEVGGFLQENIWEYYMRHQIKQPELFDLMREIRSLVESYGSDRLLVGELPDTEYLGNGTNQLHMVFNFPLMYEGLEKGTFIKNQRERIPLHPLGSWPANTLSNHDQSRIRSKYCNDNLSDPLLKQSIFLLMTMKGTPFIYYGEELGMRDYSPEDIVDFRDLKSVNLYYKELERGVAAEEARQIARKDTRDRCRTPMPWNDLENGGFSPKGVKTWLPIDPEAYEGINVQKESHEKKSILNFYKSIISYRNSSKALKYGDYVEIETSVDSLLIFKRTYIDESVYVIVNFSTNEVSIKEMGFKEASVEYCGLGGFSSDDTIGGNSLLIIKDIV